MDYKVLINLFVPEIEREFEIYIPVNRSVYHVSKLLNALISEMMFGNFPIKERIHLYNRRSGVEYKDEELVRYTDIRNGTQLVLY